MYQAFAVSLKLTFLYHLQKYNADDSHEIACSSRYNKYVKLEHFYIKSLGQKYTLSSFNNFFTHVIDVQSNYVTFL